MEILKTNMQLNLRSVYNSFVKYAKNSKNIAVDKLNNNYFLVNVKNVGTAKISIYNNDSFILSWLEDKTGKGTFQFKSDYDSVAKNFVYSADLQSTKPAKTENYSRPQLLESLNLDALYRKIMRKIKDLFINDPYFGYSPEDWDDYVHVAVYTLGDNEYRVSVGAEVDYEELERLADVLNEVVQKIDDKAYFDFAAPGLIEAYLRI